MQIIQSPINNFVYITFSILLSALITSYIIKKFKFKYNEIQSSNIKYSAIISLIIVSITIIMSPLIMIIIKKIVVTQLKISSNSGMGVIIYIIIAILTIAPTVIVSKLLNESLDSLGLTKKNIFKSIFIGFISYIIYFMCIVTVTHKLKYITSIGSLLSIWNLLNAMFTALGEEILFRGYIQNRLMKWLGDKKGLIITTLIFVCSHTAQRMIMNNMNITGVIISLVWIFPIGLFCGYLFLKCKNVAAPTIFHALYNFFANFI